MDNLYARIRNRINATMEMFWMDCHYSFKLACYRLGDDLGGRMGFESIAWWCNSKKHEWILRYFEKKFESLIEKYQKIQYEGVRTQNAPIWVCWWQGEENAPILVKQCIKSIRDNAGDATVNFITKDNVGAYLAIPPYMQAKLESGQIGLAHFADYVRVGLLEKYGGLWLDATIFATNIIPREYFEYPIFSFKGERRKTKYLSEYQWSCFCLGAWRGHALFSFLREMMELYWQTEQKAIDYLFFDYLILLGLKHVPAASCYETVPINNIHCDDLQAAMNARLPAEQWDNVIQEDTVLYKLSWREQYETCTEQGEQTVYSKFLNSLK